ncbi:Alpha/Beta hydrolase protein [Multifurca ochricompacta]|uniref:Pheromone-processing carboxypeptidase KEX1 n=1 Tax=Multifurca ochricompacta TaxID=376703 RepID=A0AAD4M4J5_9AGAM|nr:Alpha/Beta hydrolase protein [Multifurca ochricompacta]
MVLSFKGINPVAVLSLILSCQPLLRGRVHVAAAAAATATTGATPFSSSHLGPTSLGPPAPSSNAVATSSAPASNNTSTSGSVMPTSSVPAVVAPPPLKPGQLSSSFPQNSTVTSGITFDPSWQEFYLVTQGLPNITFPLGNNYAGNLPVGRPGHPNNTLFFWGFENRVGSLTVPAGQIQLSPWLIWLGGGGGPGSSSLFTSMIGNGPMLLHPDFTISQNPKSLSSLVDTFWVDQPGKCLSLICFIAIGTGFSTVDSNGYAKDENDVASDFIGFLSNLVKVFPSLATRPLYLAGEDYAGVYISYISKALLTSSNPPVILEKVAIGNGLLDDISVSTNIATINVIESFPQLIKFDQTVFKSFQSKSHLCGYDVNLTYPQQSPLPPVQPSPLLSSLWTAFGSRAQTTGLLQRRNANGQSHSLTGQLDPYYQCSIFDELFDYAANFSFPWAPGVFDLFDVADAVNPQPSIDGGIYFNSLQVRGALHAPFSKNWTSMDQYPFGSTLNSSSSANFFGDPSPPPVTFFNDLVSAAMSKNVEIILYSSANNAIAHHRSLEILIQNTTFGGTQGFTRKPSTPWVDDHGNVAGIVHQERGILYALFDSVGSLTPFANPTAAYTFFREFVLNSNATGSITIDSNDKLAVLGGEDPNVADDAPRIASEIFLGAGVTQSTLIAPSATVVAWRSFLNNATGTPTNANSGTERLPWSAGMWLSALCTLCFAFAF